ncbi:MAG TPA: hypothetical protein VK668_06710 [Mucilaginibacter sp.]|nr:hypothetical protein [Mucilaginibacter sp.]
MRKRLFPLLLISCVFISACQKNSVKPEIEPGVSEARSAGSEILVRHQTAADSALDNVTGYLRLQLAKDSINTDNVLISFRPAAKTRYVSNEDAPTFQGFGVVSMSSLSSDNVALAINALPLSKKGVTIALKVTAKTDGAYTLNMNAINSIPQIYDIWLRDTYKKDSVNLRLNPIYAFDLNNSDTNSFGNQRFKLVVREK